MAISPEDIRLLIQALEESDWDTATITFGDVSLSVSRGGAPTSASAPAAPQNGSTEAASIAPQALAPTDVPAAAAPAESPAEVAGGHTISSPGIGVFWRAPQPGAAPFVEVGSVVQAGDTLCILEVMKLMNTVVADVSGTVTAIHAENSHAVEYGTPLFTIAAS